MEGNELTSIIFLAAMETVSGLSSLSSDPLFCSIVAFCSLILLYFPQLYLRIVLSPVLIVSGTILLTLLRLLASPRPEIENPPARDENAAVTEECDSGDEDQESIANETDTDPDSEPGLDPDPCFEESFVEWNVRAPLEVIYEEHEGEEDDDPNPRKDSEPRSERHPTLSLYYPDSDSDSSSEGGFPAWDSPEDIWFRWDEEDREGLIEIALDGKRRDFQVEEENLIEIDISPPAGNGDLPVSGLINIK